MSVEASNQFHSVAVTHKGKVRDHNEDAFMSNPVSSHWAVADGMGGHEAGEVASNMLVEQLQGMFQQGNLADTVEYLDRCLIQVNSRLRAMVAGTRKIIGSTIAGLMLVPDYYLLYWCGDSRVYLYRNGKLSQETVDHTYTQGLIEQGVLTPEEALNHPERNVITRAVGAADEIYVDMDLRSLQQGDRFLICSDGLDKELDDRDIAAFLSQQHCSLELIAEQMMNCCLERGGRDNITLVLIEYCPAR